MKRWIFIIATGLLLSSCSTKTKQKLGIVTAGPNEYAVEKSRPLEIPPHYDLPAPGSIAE